MLFFELISKINAVNSFIKLVKSWGKFIWLIVILILAIICIAIYSIKQYQDNSIYISTIQHNAEKEAVKKILNKCGDKHAIGISAISASNNYLESATFSTFYACDFNYNTQDCLIDLTHNNNYKGSFDVDNETYQLLAEIANNNEVKEINLGSFNLDKYDIIKTILEKSPNYNNIHTLWLTAIINHQDKIIYAISMTAWGKSYCRDGTYYIRNLRDKLPRSKLWE